MWIVVFGPNTNKVGNKSVRDIKNVAVIGCGQLGRRHIQGLGKSSQKIMVHVYDIAPESLDFCKAFVTDVAADISNLEFTFYNDLVRLGSAIAKYDLIIVASTADERHTLLGQLISLAQSRHWLIEKPLSQSPAELDKLTAMLPKNGVWVNHFRRVVTWHQNLQLVFSCKKINQITVKSSYIGIGCNISHFVDLVEYWTSQTPVTVDVSGLDDEWHDSKRPGFKEISGTLRIVFSGGTTLLVVSDDAAPKTIIEGIFGDVNHSFSIDEGEGTVTIDGVKGDDGRLQFQSELTGMVFDDLDQTDSTDLTSYAIAAKCYHPVITALLTHWQGTTAGANKEIVPLT